MCKLFFQAFEIYRLLADLPEITDKKDFRILTRILSLPKSNPVLSIILTQILVFQNNPVLSDIQVHALIRKANTTCFSKQSSIIRVRVVKTERDRWEGEDANNTRAL